MTTCTAISSLGCVAEKPTLMEMSREGAVEASRKSDMVDAANKAVETLGLPTNMSEPIAASRLAMTQSARGEVGTEKLDFASTALRPDASAEPPPTDVAMDQLMERTLSLYADLTNYNVAWGIARRIQQDTSQLLKGS